MGDRDEFKIPVWLDNSYLEKVLRTKFSKKEVTVLNFKVENGMSKGDGFASELFRLSVESALGSFPLILKKPHGSMDIYEMMKPFELYSREITFYQKYYPAIKEILRAANEFEELAPELFYSDIESETLVLRDLRDEGYSIVDRHDRVPRDRALLIFRKLAKFHAASLVLNDNLNGELMKYEYLLNRGSYTEITRLYLRALGEEMKTWGSEFESIHLKWKYIVENYPQLGDKIIPSNRGLNVLMHADTWLNNMLFKKFDPSAGLLIDFQTIAWGSLAIDLVMFTVSSLNEEDFADREALLRNYHGHLERVLRKLKWRRIPSFEDVLQEYKDKFYHGAYGAIVKAITAGPPTNLDELAEGNVECAREKFKDPNIKREIQEIVRLMDKYGALDLRV